MGVICYLLLCIIIEKLLVGWYRFLIDVNCVILYRILWESRFNFEEFFLLVYDEDFVFILIYFDIFFFVLIKIMILRMEGRWERV